MLVGLSLGLLGGGGAILTVPILTYVVGLDAKEAIPMSLLIVGITSLASSISHARAGRVQWRTGYLFGAAGMVGAFGGGNLAHFIPGNVLLLMFAGMMGAAAIAMLRGRRNLAAVADATPDRKLHPVAVLAQGAVVGLITSLVGAGGGFMIVPTLVLVGGLSMHAAVGTSLLVIAMQSFAGLAGHLGHVSIDWKLGGGMAVIAIAGSVVGSKLAGKVPQAQLRRGFGWFLVAMATLVLAKQAPLAWPVTVGLCASAVVVATAAVTMTRRRREGVPA
ncbi:MAG: sulfite exporter TauE/SafE family protein [Myxococcales bacterium]|nr:sulfite exporter TauE/SafE family protein [Myxococcales bacterium]